MQRVQISHQTLYTYSAPVTLGPHQMFIRPREGHDIRIASSALEISPAHTIRWERDVHNNSVAHVHFSEPSNTLSINSEVVVEQYNQEPFQFSIDPRSAKFPFLLTPAERIDLMPYLTPSYPDDQGQVATWIERFWTPGNTADTLTLLMEINTTIANEFAYSRREEPGVQRPAKTIADASGSCRDFATLMIEACRFLALPARFVSGYSLTEDIPAAMGSTHAWTEVYLPGTGWKGFDSTGGIMTGPAHIAIAVGRDPESLPPVSGSFAGNGQTVTSTLDVKVEVKRLP